MTGQSILIIDDEVLILDTMSKDLLDKGYKVDTAQNGEDGIKKFRLGNHDLVISDLVMEGLSGFQVAKSVKELKPRTKIIFITGYGNQNSAIEAIRLGASDYFIKPYNRNELFQRISKCFEEQNSVGQGMSLILIEKIENNSLSRKEKEVVALLLKGQSDKEIALSLYISINTVKTHLKKIYNKLEIKGRKELLKLATG